MSLIEVLPPSSKSGAHPGWAYVPDTGVDPSKAALQPSGSRKRARNGAAIPRTDTTARQQNAILKRLLELDKENHRDGSGGGGGANIPVPVRARDGAGRGKCLPFLWRVC
jgi:zinc finger HIT domain-containing protein 1